MLILVTGSAGFIGKHLMEALGRRPEVQVIGYDVGTPQEVLEQGLREADVIYHLAGVNRPQNVEDFQTGNADFTKSLCARLLEIRAKAGSLTSDLRPPPLFVLSSSIQAELENPYGVSKREAEEAVKQWAEQAARCKLQGAASALASQLQAPPSLLQAPRAIIFRLKNVFGKWCRPNYNSVTATFCHNIAHDLPITISDASRQLDLVYIDDVIAAFLAVLEPPFPAPGSPLPAPSQAPTDIRPLTSDLFSYRAVPRSFTLTLGELAARIRSFRESRNTLVLPSFSDDFTHCLYATYLSYLDGPDFAYGLDIKTDNRGGLAEFVKSESFGQIFVSRTKPGITRGNHYHHTKTEKFLVVEGDAVIRFRHVLSGVPSSGSSFPAPRSAATDLRPPTSDLCPQIIEHRISGKDFRVVDIPPGYTHSIENVGAGELVVLFWASEIFDPAKPDTYPAPVK